MRLNVLTGIVVAVCLLVFIWANNHDTASIPLLVFVLGALGSVIREQVAALALIKEQPYSKPELLYAAPFIGGLLALLFMLFLMSGLLGGSLFPNFLISDTAFESARHSLRSGISLASNLDFYKMIAWSIVVGYSEKIVVSRLDQIANSRPQA
ncbi:hypothetical protein [Halioxenophilus aromaticivorans]|uniref:Uncharacterized protein n=1 Tax=Halioxenophilus aromaticivorans TaxID=1306992 RepID=A0AAV3U660_9ALTE